jgi:NAD(P)-dependent dehydrogenase (short-subunit alcohol dehydrogenase family)
MELPPTRDLAVAAGATLAAVLTFYHIRERRSRTRKIQRTDERVLILGASSGVGRALAHMYAQRGARVCVVGRRKKEIEEVELECKTIQRIKESEEDRNAFSVCADFADPEQMVVLRDVIQAGESPSLSVSFSGRIS